MTPDVRVDSCCFRWDVVRGPHERFSKSFCPAKCSTSVAKVLAIGRHKSCFLRFHQDLEVSGVHAEMQFVQDSGMMILRDNNSTNGTKLNGERLTPRHDYLLRTNDLIIVGRTALRVQIRDPLHHSQPQQQATSDRTSNSSNDTNSNANSETESLVPSKHIIKPLADRPNGKENVSTQPQVPSPDADFVLQRAERPLKRKRPPPSSSTPVVHAGVHVNASSSVETRVVCMICGENLAHKDFLQQQMHLNACIDRKETAAKRHTTATSRSKQQSSLEKEQMQLAIAMSKSMASNTQTLDMQLALLTSELNRVDQEMQKLTEKRERIQKKMQRLAKQREKLRPSQVIPPDALELNVTSILDVLFPMERCVRSFGPPFERNKSKPKLCLWAKAAQNMLEDDFEMTFADGKLGHRIATPAGEGESHEQERLERQVECLAACAPRGIERVFPKWRENLEFLLRQSSAEDIELASKAMQESVNQEEASDECLKACSFFDRVMSAVAHHMKQQQQQPPRGDNPVNKNKEEVAADENMDDAQESSVPSSPVANEMELQEPERELVAIDLTDSPAKVIQPTCQQPNQGSSIVDLDESVEILSSGDCAPSPYIATIPEEPAPPKYSTRTDQTTVIEQNAAGAPVEAFSGDCSVSAQSSREDQVPSMSGASVTMDATVNMEMGEEKAECGLDIRLSAALQAHTPVYEEILLLKAIDFDSLHTHLIQVVGVQCTKKKLQSFLDREGISFTRHNLPRK